jgi:magnesium-transporting ATPase (P-type)
VEWETRAKNFMFTGKYFLERLLFDTIRFGEWHKMSSEEIVPGDILSILHVKDGDNVVPCDCLLLKGVAVVNEASLTGESHPQMKEELSVDDENATVPLEMVCYPLTLENSPSPSERPSQSQHVVWRYQSHATTAGKG